MSSGGTDLTPTLVGSGIEIVSAGGTALSGTVSSRRLGRDIRLGRQRDGRAGGTLTVSFGGTADHLTIQSGGMFGVLGTVLSNVVAAKGGTEFVWSGGIIHGGATGTGTLDSGSVTVLSGGALDHATVFSGGALNTGHDIAVSSDGVLDAAGITTSNVTASRPSRPAALRAAPPIPAPSLGRHGQRAVRPHHGVRERAETTARTGRGWTQAEACGA